MKWRIAVAAAAVAAWVTYRSLPPPAVRLPVGELPPQVRGVFHVHTRASDGSGTVDEVAAAAARAGLQFVVVSDHGDGTRAPAAPEYRSGVLCIDAVEISTGGGHVVALGLPASPYPLGGEPRDVVEDVRRLGGVSIAAHPESTNPEARWIDWTSGIDGLEWQNGDSEWRDESIWTLAHALLSYPFRRSTLSLVLDRPDSVLRRWDALTSRRQVVALAGSDAHGGFSLDVGRPGRGPVVRVPSYEAVFRTFSLSLSPLTLSGDAASDADAVLEAIRRGHVYSAIDAIASPGRVAFSATSRGRRVEAGDVVPGGAEVNLQVFSNAPREATVRLFKNGAELAASSGPSLEHVVGGEVAVYRVELQLPTAPGDPPAPWVLTNPIYVGSAGQPVASARPPARGVARQYDDGVATGWSVESSSRSLGALDVVRTLSGTELRLRWALGGTEAEGPYAALVMPAGPALSQHDRISFSIRASQPMRVGLQIREPIGTASDRWQRSVFVDEQAREVTVWFDDMQPIGPTTRRRPVLPNVRDILFVIDTVNTRPGANGSLWIDDVKYGR